MHLQILSKKGCQIMVFEPAPILLPCPQYEVSSRLRDHFYLLRCSPTRHTCTKTYEVGAGAEGSLVGELVIHETVATQESLDHPQSSLDALVQGQFVQLRDHLAQVRWSRTQLARLPIDHEKGRLTVWGNVCIRKQDTIG